MNPAVPTVPRLAFPFLPRRAVLLALIGSAVACVSCRRSGSAPSNAVPQRVISLTPNTTEALFAIGAGESVVGRSRYCDYPSEAQRLPSVGGYVDPSFEAILALRPDLVVGARGPAGRAMVDRLEARGVRTWFPTTESIAEIEAMILGLSDRLDRRTQGDKVIADLHSSLASIDRQLVGKPRPRTLLVFGLAPVVAAGPGSFSDEMLQRAGMTNAIAAGSKYPTLGMEAIVAMAPDIIIDASVAEGHGTTRISTDQPGWAALRAVREGRIAAVEDDFVLRPGPRIALGIARLASIAHPEITLP